MVAEDLFVQPLACLGCLGDTVGDSYSFWYEIRADSHSFSRAFVFASLHGAILSGTLAGLRRFSDGLLPLVHEVRHAGLCRQFVEDLVVRRSESTSASEVAQMLVDTRVQLNVPVVDEAFRVCVSILAGASCACLAFEPLFDVATHSHLLASELVTGEDLAVPSVFDTKVRLLVNTEEGRLTMVDFGTSDTHGTGVHLLHRSNPNRFDVLVPWDSLDASVWEAHQRLQDHHTCSESVSASFRRLCHIAVVTRAWQELLQGEAAENRVALSREHLEMFCRGVQKTDVLRDLDLDVVLPVFGALGHTDIAQKDVASLLGLHDESAPSIPGSEAVGEVRVPLSPSDISRGAVVHCVRETEILDIETSEVMVVGRLVPHLSYFALDTVTCHKGRLLVPLFPVGFASLNAFGQAHSTAGPQGSAVVCSADAPRDAEVPAIDDCEFETEQTVVGWNPETGRVFLRDRHQSLLRNVTISGQQIPIFRTEGDAWYAVYCVPLLSLFPTQVERNKLLKRCLGKHMRMPLIVKKELRDGGYKWSRRCCVHVDRLTEHFAELGIHQGWTEALEAVVALPTPTAGKLGEEHDVARKKKPKSAAMERRCYACILAGRKCARRKPDERLCTRCRCLNLSWKQCAIIPQQVQHRHNDLQCHICGCGAADGALCILCPLRVCNAPSCRQAAHVERTPYFMCCHCLGVPQACGCGALGRIVLNVLFRMPLLHLASTSPHSHGTSEGTWLDTANHWTPVTAADLDRLHTALRHVRQSPGSLQEMVGSANQWLEQHPWTVAQLVQRMAQTQWRLNAAAQKAQPAKRDLKRGRMTWEILPSKPLPSNTLVSPRVAVAARVEDCTQPVRRSRRLMGCSPLVDQPGDTLPLQDRSSSA